MRVVDIITKKRDKKELSEEEIKFLIDGYTNDQIPDYQMSAWAMAVLLNGMTEAETTNLTLAMANSGSILDLSGIVPISVDKHSTGGVGDKTTLVVAPIVAACGLPVGKMSGRGLGFSGGTLDKLESIPGFRTHLSKMEFVDQLKRIGIVISGQSEILAPADGKLYALRDVTGTVQSIPLIASSIMSKKIAAGAQAIVLDVKIGEGAFMRSLDDGRRLAALMVAIAKLANRRAVALLSDMNQPLGSAVGNSLEVIEAIHTLRGEGPIDFHQHCVTVAEHMLILGKVAETESQARQMVDHVFKTGDALEKFKNLVSAQGGDTRYIESPDLFPRSQIQREILAEMDGYVAGMNARLVGDASVLLGAGRQVKGDMVDHYVGIEVFAKVGDYVYKGQPLLRIHANLEDTYKVAEEELQQAISIAHQPVEPLPLFYGVIES